jgi:thiol-disulfide isomerase/thioredoxin
MSVTEQQLSDWAARVPADPQTGEPVAFVACYATWCPHCQHMRDELQKMFQGSSVQMDSQGMPRTPFTRFVEEKQAGRLRGIRGFPTVRRYDGGVARESDPEELYAFLRTKLRSATGGARRVVGGAVPPMRYRNVMAARRAGARGGAVAYDGFQQKRSSRCQRTSGRACSRSTASREDDLAALRRRFVAELRRKLSRSSRGRR